MTKVLIVEDEEFLRTGLAEFLRAHGYVVDEASTTASAKAKFTSFQPDVVLLDYFLPEGTALDLLPDFREADPLASIVVLTGHGTIDLAVSAVKLGAEQFLTKPIEFDSLRVILERTVDKQRYKRRADATSSARQSGLWDPFLGTSRAIRALAEDARRVAEADTPVLILGETGAGKGVLARWLHANGRRAQEPFVDTNCAGFSPELLDTELFGHERGAFTGAVAAKQGLVEVAHKGVLFLDEIGDMSLQTQPKLLKILEEQRVRRVGSVRDRIVDVQMIAATNCDLTAAVAEKRFRSDLYYRISMIPLQIPPIRERLEDVIPLAHSILARIASRYRYHRVELSSSAEQALTSYDWPGNLRELRNVLERAVLHAGRDTISAKELRLPATADARAVVAPPCTSCTLEDVERQHIEQVLAANDGNVVRTAKALGISRSAFYGKLKKHRVRPPSERAHSDGPADGPDGAGSGAAAAARGR